MIETVYLLHFTLLIVLGLIPGSSSVPNHLKHLLEELSGSHLRFSANIFAPFFSIRIGPDGAFTYEGFHVEVVKFMAQALNVTYSFVYPNATEADIVGLMDATANQLLRNEIDVNDFGYPLSENYCSKMDCSFLIFQSRLGMIVPWPETESRVVAPIKPFQLPVWLWLCATCLLMLFLLVWIPKMYLKYANGGKTRQSAQTKDFIKHITYGNAAVYIWTILMSQGNWVKFKPLSFRIMIAAFCLTAMVLDNAYSSNLISYITVPKFMPVTKSVDDLATRRYQDILFLTEKNEDMAKMFLAATSGPEKLIGDSLRKHPENLFTNPYKGIEMLCSGKFAYMSGDVRLYPFLDIVNKKTGRCLLTVSNKDMPNILGFTYFVVYTFAKNWRYTDAVNSKIQLWRESGLAEFWVKIILPRKEECFLENYVSAKAKLKILSLSDVSGTFSILLLGIALSILVFLVECLIGMIRRNNNRVIVI